VGIEKKKSRIDSTTARPSRRRRPQRSTMSSSSSLPIYIPVMVDFKVTKKKKTHHNYKTLDERLVSFTEKQAETALSAQQDRGANGRGDHEEAESERRT
jgi:hypothetical protein